MSYQLFHTDGRCFIEVFGNISQDGRTPTRTYYSPNQCLFNTPDRTPQAEYPGLVMDEEDSLDSQSFQSHVSRSRPSL